jgi:hypothetical protein
VRDRTDKKVGKMFRLAVGALYAETDGGKRQIVVKELLRR